MMLTQRLHQLPALAVLAVALVAMAALQWGAERWLLAPVALANAQLAQRASAARATAIVAPQTGLSGREQVQLILSKLHNRELLTLRLEKLHQSAAASGVVVRKANYQIKELPGGIYRQEIQAEVGGTYLAIRSFVADMQVRDDAAALESLEIGRAPGGTTLRAQLRIVLFFKGADL